VVGQGQVGTLGSAVSVDTLVFLATAVCQGIQAIAESVDTVEVVYRVTLVNRVSVVLVRLGIRVLDYQATLDSVVCQGIQDLDYQATQGSQGSVELVRLGIQE
jgi:hypothetical protein